MTAAYLEKLNDRLGSAERTQRAPDKDRCRRAHTLDVEVR